MCNFNYSKKTMGPTKTAWTGSKNINSIILKLQLQPTPLHQITIIFIIIIAITLVTVIVTIPGDAQPPPTAHNPTNSTKIYQNKYRKCQSKTSLKYGEEVIEMP